MDEVLRNVLFSRLSKKSRKTVLMIDFFKSIWKYFFVDTLAVKIGDKWSYVHSNIVGISGT